MINLLLIFVNFLIFSDCAKILVINSVPSTNHNVVLRAFNKALLEQGHNVVFATTDVEYPEGTSPNNLKEIDLSDSLYTSLKEIVPDIKTELSSYEYHNTVFDSFNNIGHFFLKNDKLGKLIAEEKFDIIVLEAIHKVLLPLTGKTPVIQVSSFGSMNDYDTSGAPVHPLLYPELVTQRIGNLTKWEEVKEVFGYLSQLYIANNKEDEYNEIVKSIYPQSPKLNELLSNVDLIFMNTVPILEENRPIPQGICNIMGILDKPRKGLPLDLQIYLDSSKNGVIYFSLGTNVQPSSLPKTKMEKLINGMSRLNYDILLKWDKDVPKLPDNVKVANWFPQIDVLSHPNVKLFITQAGARSTEEAIYAGVPVLGIPLLVDQRVNAEKYVRHSIGKKLDFEYIKEDDFVESVESIIRNESYHQNIEKLRDIIQDQQYSPQELISFWTNYVARFQGAKHLRSVPSNMSWREYYELDLLLTLISAFLLTILSIISVIVYLFKQLFKRPTNNGPGYLISYDSRKYY